MPRKNQFILENVKLFSPNIYAPEVHGTYQTFGLSFFLDILPQEQWPHVAPRTANAQQLARHPILAGRMLGRVFNPEAPLVIAFEGNTMLTESRVLQFCNDTNVPRDMLFDGITAEVLFEAVSSRNNQSAVSYVPLAVRVHAADLLEKYEIIMSDRSFDEGIPRSYQWTLQPPSSNSSK